MAEKKIQTGHVDVELTTPLKVDSAAVKVLRMREPTVDDRLVHDATEGSDGEKEIALLANLCMQTPADIRKLTLRDYAKLQKAYFGFLV